MSGWIKLYRQFRDWEWYQDSNMVHLYIHMLLKANHKESIWRGIAVQPGQFVSGRKALSVETGIPESTIRTCLNRLQESGTLTSKSTNKFTLYTLLKWEFFQEIDVFAASKSTNNQPANSPTINQLTHQQLTTNKNIKKERKEKKGTNVPKEKAAPSQSLVEFESFWSGCQKKVGKPAALKAWQKMRKENRTTLTGEQLLERYNSIVEMETKERGTAQYVPHPATWINQDRWDDDVIEPIKKYPFNQRVYYVTTEDTHPLNHDILAWVLDRKWYCDDKTGKVFNDKGELQTNITIDPEGDLEKW
jgi:hypothetical protein